ncbi:MAG: ATP-binding protein [Thermohalobaculum sp.]|nr:ATP-binding protein [Thermohalobaculum sp.]
MPENDESSALPRSSVERYCPLLAQARISGGPLCGPSEDIAALRRELALFEMAERLGSIGHWHWPVGAERAEWSTEAWRIHGLTPTPRGPRLADALARYHPDDRHAIETAFARSVRTGAPFDLEVRLTLSDGRLRAINAVGRAERCADGKVCALFGVLRDVTEERRALTRATRAETQLRDAVEALTDGFALYDAEDRLVLCNRRYREIYAESAEAMHPGASFESILRHGLAHGQFPEAARREEAWLAERLRRHHDLCHVIEQELPGDRWLRIVESTTADGGRVGFRVDITALKRQQRELEAARARAEAASRAKTAFLANMSHEIRTPMNGVIGMAAALEPLVPEGRARQMLAAIAESGETLMAILNDILDVSKIEAGRITFESCRFSLDEIARRIERIHTLKAAEHGLSLGVSVAPGLPCLRLGDPVRVQQILHNLVGNAIKFTPAGEVVLSIGPAPGAPDRVLFEVRDTGIGMSAREISRVFERFIQGDDATARQFGGTGLGLAITRGLAEAMGGEVSVEARPGEGSTFRVVLPLPVAAPETAPPRAPDLAARLPAGLRLLAADDNRVNRMVLMACLAPLGAEVTMVENGADAVAAHAAALAQGSGFDVLLLDISMPGMDGIAVLDAIRRAEAAAARPPVPAIAVTANAMAHQVERYLAAGFNAHLAKPFRRDALEACIAGALDPGTCPA